MSQPTMRLEITRLNSDETLYAVTGDQGLGTRVVKNHELRQWLVGLGIGESTIAAVLGVRPNESTSIDVGNPGRLYGEDAKAG